MTTKLERAFLNLTHGKSPSTPLDSAHDSAQVHHSSQQSGRGDNHNGDGGSGLGGGTDGKGKGKDTKPSGGYDDTPLNPTPGEVYTVKITFHRASHVPVADLTTLSSDPYLLATLTTDLPTRHKEDPPLRYRTRTKHADLNPSWDEHWIVAGLPSTGFELECRMFDEDPSDHDDRLGVAYINIPSIGSSTWSDLKDQPFEIHKRRSSQRANLSRTLAHLTHPSKRRKAGAANHSDRTHYESLYVSIQLLGPTPQDQNLGKAYTKGPSYFRIHYSPLIGRMMGLKNGGEEDRDGDEMGGDDGEDTGEKDGQGGKVKKYDFQTNELQLPGPVPNELYHRYVDFSSFVNGMFNSTGIRGRLLNKVLHHQHARLYNFDKRTIYGSFDGPGEEMTRKFLDMAHFDEGGRTFTYVVTSDAMMRFTETGKEFGIDLLSKHTMHSDVNIYIAWSGEFLIRRRRHAHDNKPNDTHGPNPIPGGPPNAPPPKDVSLYELIIDNDSGTYRPNADLIPIFKSFMERCLPGLHIRVYNGFDKELEHIKEEQNAIKKKEGDKKVYYQDGMSSSDDDANSSLSSSDEEALADHAERLRLGEEREEKADAGKTGGGRLEHGVAFLEKPVEEIKKRL